MKVGRFLIKRDETDDGYNDPPRPFIEHLIDLRDCLLHCVIAWVLCEIIIIPFAPKITEWIIAPAGLSTDKVQGLGWTAGFSILIKIMLWGGHGAQHAVPALLHHAFRFSRIETHRALNHCLLPVRFDVSFWYRRLDGLCGDP